MAIMTNPVQNEESRESELDRRIEELIGKMVNDEATDQDQTRYEQLVAQRAKLMRPASPRLQSNAARLLRRA